MAGGVGKYSFIYYKNITVEGQMAYITLLLFKSQRGKPIFAIQIQSEENWFSRLFIYQAGTICKKPGFPADTEES